MKPILRADLIVTQAEVNGEATYTVRDDVTGESFRMYAVEYAIAQRLDGQRDLSGIIAAVQTDLQLPVTRAQLLDFLRELDARGLILGFVEPAESSAPAKDEAATPQSNFTQTETLNITPEAIAAMGAQAALPTPMDDAETVASPGDAVTAGAFALVTQELVLHERGSQALAKAGLTEELSVDPGEVQKLLRDALLRMVDDDVGGAVSILHAAHALDPSDERVSVLAEATQTAYARGTKEAVQALKAQGANLFPDLMPDAQGRATTQPNPAAPTVAPPGHAAPPKAPHNAKAAHPKAVYAAVAAALLAVAAWGLWGRFGAAKALGVTSQTVALVPHEHRLSPAHSVRGEVVGSLSFASGGVVAQLPAVGAKVAPQELVASLKLPPPVRQHLLVLGQRARGAELHVMRLQRQREQLVAEQRALVAQGKQDKRRAGELKRRRLLRRIQRDERQVRVALVTAQSRRAQAEQDYKAQAEAARPLQIFAPKAGVVAAVTAQVGQTVAPKAPVVELIDGERLIVTFVLETDVDPPSVGTQVTVLTGKNGRRALQAKVLDTQELAASAQMGAKASAPGNLVRLAIDGPELPRAPESYAWVADSSPKALQVPRAALVAPTDRAPAHLWQLQDGVLTPLPVTVLESSADSVWVAPKEPPVAANMAYVVAAKAGGRSVEPRSLTAGAAATAL